jgi:PHP domain-containing protein
MLKGPLHVHSTYSDGEFTLAELRQIYAAQGCSFVCITDHAEYFDGESIRAYLQDLKRYSDREFCFVPGLEYRCEREMHILGYGATALVPTKAPEAIIRHIASQGATSVIAHPKNEFFSWIEGFEILPHGIETWNSKYDGRYAPRPGTFALLQRLRQRSPEMHAFYGQDLHWKNQFRGLCVVIGGDTPDPSAILAALSAGSYHAQKDDLQLPASGILPETLLAEFGEAHARSRRLRQIFTNGKQTLDRIGVRVPTSLKAQLRRIF